MFVMGSKTPFLMDKGMKNLLIFSYLNSYLLWYDICKENHHVYFN